MSVIGIDIGSQTCFIAVARQGGIETIANEVSDRCTPNCVSMGEKSRCMGAAAKNQMISNYKNTIVGWKQLIGRKFNDPVVQREIKYMAPEVTEGPNNTISIRVRYAGEMQSFKPEQVAAMMLSKLKEVAEVALKAKVVDCVINVPCYYTDVQRRAMLDAASLVGLNVLRLMNDTAATALNYGIYKQDLPTPEEKPRHVVFIDMGYTDTQLSLCAFNKGKLTVLTTVADPDLGGQTFDRLLADYLSDEFRGKYKIDVKSSPKAYLRLLGECERLKKLMSANSQEIPLNIECFMDDKDVTSKMCRAKLEELAEGTLQKMEKLMKSVLEFSKLKPDDVYSVEVVGGSSRIPAVKQLVRKVFGKDASVTLNADEAVARGCALQCAIQSPNFRVRDFAVQDAQLYPIVLSWQGGFIEEEGGNSMEVCGKFHTFPFLKQLTFYRTEKFELEARYNSPDIPPENSFIGSFVVDDVKPQATGESSKVKVKVRVNMHGIFNVTSASMTEKIEAPAVEEPMDVSDIDKATEANSTAGKPGEGESKMDGEGAGSEQQGGEQAQVNKDGINENGVESGMDTNEKKEEEEGGTTEKKQGGAKKQKVKVIDLKVVPRVPRMSKDEINLLMEKEGQMAMQDKMEKERMDAKNAVEEYVYDMRKKICEEMEQFILDKDKEVFMKDLDDTENWLYDEGEDLNKQSYVDKLNSLKKQGNPVVDRYREFTDRPAALETLGQTIQLLNKVLEAYQAKEERYDHIDAVEMDKVRAAVAEKQTWFEKQCGVLAQHPHHLPPPTTVAQIKAQRESLVSTCNPIVNKPKPKPPKVEPPKDAPAKDNTPNGPQQPDTNGGEAGDTANSKMESGGSPEQAPGEGHKFNGISNSAQLKRKRTNMTGM